MKYLLFPFAVLYGWITSLRNHLYDLKIWKSVEFDINVISVGNLSVGGSGKTPMVEYITRLLMNSDHQPAILSRGYKRKTKGFRIADEQDDTSSIGDEPFQYFRKFKQDVPVVVAEERIFAIPELLFSHEERDSVICDDAFQHRALRPGFSILLSTYQKPFFRDHMLPMGRLRESRKGANRANTIVFTKCPTTGNLEKQAYRKAAKEYAEDDTPIFFSSIKYGTPVPINDGEVNFSEKVILLSGLANAQELVEYVKGEFNLLHHIEKPDHYRYTESDISGIKTAYQQCIGEGKTEVSILTTEKDAVKLQEINGISDLPIYYLPIEVVILDEGDKFDALILDSFGH